MIVIDESYTSLVENEHRFFAIKKVLSLFLCMVLVVSFPVYAYAAEDDTADGKIDVPGAVVDASDGLPSENNEGLGESVPNTEDIKGDESDNSGEEHEVSDLQSNSSLEKDRQEQAIEAGALEDGVYSIRCFSDNSLALDVTSASGANGAALVLWRVNGQKNQQFYIERQGIETYSIKALHSGKVLATPGFSSSSGARILQWSDNATNNMRWILSLSKSGGYTVSSVDTGKVLDYAANKPSAGSPLVVWENNYSEKQVFSFIPEKESPSLSQPVLGEQHLQDGVYSIKSVVNENFSLGISDDIDSNGAKLMLEKNQSLVSQKFLLSFESYDNGLGVYRVAILQSSKVIAASGIGAKRGASIVQWDDNETANMRWSLMKNPTGQNGYSLVSADTGLKMDFAGNSPSSGLEMVLWENTESPKQYFKFEQEELVSDGYYKILSSGNQNLGVALNGSAISPSINTILQSANVGLLQKFQILNNEDGTCRIKSLHSGFYLGLDQSGMVVTKTTSGELSQKWIISTDEYGGFSFNTLNSQGALYSLWTGGNNFSGASLWGRESAVKDVDQSFKVKLADVIDSDTYFIRSSLDIGYGLSINSSSIELGQAFCLAYSSDSVRQRFLIENTDRNVVKIASQISGKTLCVGYGLPQGASVIQWEDNGTSNMRWVVEPTFKGSVYFRNVANNMYLDFSSNTPSSMAGMVVWGFHGGDKQKFNVIPSSVACKTEDIRDYIISAPNSRIISGLGGYEPSYQVLQNLSSSVSTIRNEGADIGFVMVDLTTGKGVSYNIDGVFYGASSIKGPYVASLAACQPSSVFRWGSTMELAIRFSDNNAYDSLRIAFGDAPMRQWVSVKTLAS